MWNDQSNYQYKAWEWFVTDVIWWKLNRAALVCHLQYSKRRGREIQSERSAITLGQSTRCKSGMEERGENNTDWCWNRPSAGCCRKVDGHSNLIWSLTNDSGDRPSIKDLIWELYLIWLSPKSKTQQFLMTSKREKQLVLTFRKLEPEKFSIFTFKKSKVFSSN